MSNDYCSSLQELLSTIERLTGPDGCPWDKAQTPQSLADYVIEESHELVAAIRASDSREICSELGDVFFLLLLITSFYQKENKFSLSDVLDGNRLKMIRRHPHVFADAHFENLSEQLKAWESIKRSEHKENTRLFDSLPRTLPPLVKAYRIHSKAARVGFTWSEDEEVEQQVESEWLEFLDVCLNGTKEEQKHELGDLLFSLVELGRRKEIKASEALDLATSRFLKRFACMEDLAGTQGKNLADMDLDEQNELWDKAKALENEDKSVD